MRWWPARCTPGSSASPGPGPLPTRCCSRPRSSTCNNDLRISASFAYTSASFAEVAALLGSGQIRPGPLITHRFPLEAYAEAYQVLRSASGPRGKVILDVSAP